MSTITFEALDPNFMALSRAQRRAAIAKDVLHQLSVNKLLAKHGVYFEVNVAKEEVLSAIKNDETRCHVCAIGALFVCGFRLGGIEPAFRHPYVGVNRTTIIEGLRSTFGDDELRVMDHWFEFGSREDNACFGPEDKIRKIMDVIIKTPGEPVVPWRSV